MSCTKYGPRGRAARAGDPLFFSSLYTKTCTRTRSGAETADATYGRLPRSRADRRRAQACGARRSRADIGARQQPLRGGDDGGARRVETRWRGAAREDNRAIVASPGSARTSSPHRLAQCADASFYYRPRRGGVGDAGGIEPACTDAPDGAPPPWGTQRRTRHRRMTTVSSTSSFRRRLLRGCQAAGRGTTFGAGCAARRAASAPSPPHLHSTRAHSAPSCCGHELARSLGIRAQLLRSARASRRAANGARAGRWQMERFSGAALLSDAPGAGRSGAEARIVRRQKKVARSTN